MALRSCYMGILRQWKRATWGREQAQKGQNQRGHHKKHLMPQKPKTVAKKCMFMYEWKESLCLLCSELFYITSLLHINILRAQKYYRFMPGLNLLNKCISCVHAELCCQILALILLLGAWCGHWLEAELLYRDYKFSKGDFSLSVALMFPLFKTEKICDAES